VSHLAPIRVPNRPKPAVSVERRADGALVLSAEQTLAENLPLMIDWLERAALRRPDVTFLAERRGPGRNWQHLSYAETWATTGAIASWLIAQGFGPHSAPVAILSDNSLENALFLFGAMRAGVPVASVSPNYSQAADLARLDHVLDIVQPALVFAQDSQAYGAALDHAAQRAARLVTVDGGRGVAFAALTACSVDAAVAERRQHITAATLAKILFTSGSTGTPKGVLNTHGNLAASAEMIHAVSEPVDSQHVAVALDWLPWHHTWGGNAVLGSIVRIAGTLFIDGGRPIEGRFQETLENLRELSPTSFASVPAAFPLLLDALERDTDLRAKFFKNMQSAGYGGALLPQENFDRLQDVATRHRGTRLSFDCGWGMTETTSTGLMATGGVDRAGVLGLPQPGMLAKLVPAGDRYELRVKGPNVTPGYYRDPAATAAAFDDEGFFRTGDAVRWVDESRPEAGIAFAGRLSEEFKLASGTWIQATTLRSRLIDALQPYVRDLVVAAPDRPWLGALVWLDETACREAGGAAHWRSALSQRLAAFNSGAGGSSARVLRLLPLEAPPSAANGEVTDKRSINGRRVLETRAAEVARLYAEPADPTAIQAGGSA
jgi:feruloyl-CoA synthase